MKRASRGQAMVETMLIITFVTILMFATVQLCTVVVNDMIANEAASAINRAVMVTSERTKNSNTSMKAALYVFSRWPSPVSEALEKWDW